jgi:hypothetical protein
LNIVIAVSTERRDEEGGVVIEGVVAGDGEEEVTLNILVLWAPDFLAPFVDDGILVWVVSNGGGAGRGSEEVGEELGFWGDGERKVGEDGSGQGRGGDDGDGGFNDGWWEVLVRDVSKRDSFDNFFKLMVDVCILMLGGRGVLELRAYNISLFRGNVGKDMEEVGWGDGDGGWGLGAVGVEVCGRVTTTGAEVILGVVGTIKVVLDDLVGGGDVNLVSVVDLGPIGNREGGGDDKGG